MNVSVATGASVSAGDTVSVGVAEIELDVITRICPRNAAVVVSDANTTSFPMNWSAAVPANVLADVMIDVVVDADPTVHVTIALNALCRAIPTATSRTSFRFAGTASSWISAGANLAPVTPNA